MNAAIPCIVFYNVGMVGWPRWDHLSILGSFNTTVKRHWKDLKTRRGRGWICSSHDMLNSGLLKAWMKFFSFDHILIIVWLDTAPPIWCLEDVLISRAIQSSEKTFEEAYWHLDTFDKITLFNDADCDNECRFNFISYTGRWSKEFPKHLCCPRTYQAWATYC